MEKVPLKELKENLSYWTEKASKGDTIEVTKYNKPYVRLVSSHPPGLTIGSKVGQPLPPSPFKKGLKVDWKKALDEDRGDPDE